MPPCVIEPAALPPGAVQIVLPDQTAALSCDAVDERTVALRDGERTVVCSASSSSTTQEESEAHLRESLAVAVAEQHKELKIVKPDGVDVGVTLCNTRATAQRERSRLMIRRHSDPGVRSLPAITTAAPHRPSSPPPPSPSSPRLSEGSADGGGGAPDAHAGLGVRVMSLKPGGLAAQAGLLEGDLIVAVNGVPVTEHQDAIGLIDGADAVVSLVVRGFNRRVALDRVRRLGFSVVRTATGGVRISHVSPDGEAAHAGLLVGDEVLAAQGVLLESAKQAARVVRAADGVLSLTVADDKAQIVLDKAAGEVGLTVTNVEGAHGAKSEGVRVCGIAAGGVAAKAGVELGHVIHSVNGVLVHDHRRAIEIVNAASRHVRLVVQQSTRPQVVVINPWSG